MKILQHCSWGGSLFFAGFRLSLGVLLNPREKRGMGVLPLKAVTETEFL